VVDTANGRVYLLYSDGGTGSPSKGNSMEYAVNNGTAWKRATIIKDRKRPGLYRATLVDAKGSSITIWGKSNQQYIRNIIEQAA